MTERREEYSLAPPVNETSLEVVKPHLQIEVERLSKSCPALLEQITTHLANPDDPTGLRLFNLLTYAQGLQRSAELAVNLLGQIDASRAKTAAQHPASDAPGQGESDGNDREWWER